MVTRRKLLFGGAGLAFLAACSAFPRPVPERPIEATLPGNKKISVVFYSSHRENIHDANKLRPVLKSFNPHVLCIDHIAAGEIYARQLEDDFAKGNIAAGDIYRKKLREVVNEHGGARLFVLDRFSDKDAKTFTRIGLASHQAQGEAFIAFRSGNADHAIEKFTKALEQWEKLSTARHSRAKQVISNLRTELVRRYPELAKEKDLRVVISVEPWLTPLYLHVLKSGFANVTQKVTVKIKMKTGREEEVNYPRYSRHYLNPVESHVFKAIMQEKPLSLSQEEVARALLGIMLTEHSRGLGVNSFNSAAFANIAVSGVSLALFKRLSNTLKGEKDVKQPAFMTVGKPAPLPALLKALESEGIKLPNTSDDIYLFLRRNNVPLSL